MVPHQARRHVARHLPSLTKQPAIVPSAGDTEGIAHFGRPCTFSRKVGLQQALHGVAQFVERIVDDRVQADVDPSRSAAAVAFASGRTLKPMTTAFDADASITSLR